MIIDDWWKSLRSIIFIIIGRIPSIVNRRSKIVNSLVIETTG